MEQNLILSILLVVVVSGLSNGAHHQSTMFAEQITDYQELSTNLTDSSEPFRILEHTITPYDVSPDQLKLVGRYVFLAPLENNLYFVGFEETIDKSDAAKKVLSELIVKNLVTSIYKVQRVKSFRPQKV